MINISKIYCEKSGQSDALRYPEKKTNKPIVVFNCTARCNLKCIHCYSSSDSSCDAFELSTQQAKGLIDQVAGFGCPVILFSGGEPLLRTDLYELIEYAGNKKLRTVISTNGTLLSEQAVEKLARLNLNYAGISLDGPESLHDRFRGVKGSYAGTMKGIANCQKAGIRTGLRFTMTRGNVDQIEQVFQIAAEHDVRRLCFYHLIRTGRAEQLSEQMPTSDQTRKAIDEIVWFTKQAVSAGTVDEVLTVGNHADGPYLVQKMQAENHSGTGQAIELLRRAAGNRVGQNISAVDWSGQVYPDQFWRNYSLGNILERSFGQIWEDVSDPVLKILRNKQEFMDPKCRWCNWFELCGGNFRSLTGKADIENWQNEPPCYLTEKEIQMEIPAGE